MGAGAGVRRVVGVGHGLKGKGHLQLFRLAQRGRNGQGRGSRAIGGRSGRIEALAGTFILSDAQAKGIRDVREPLYTVLFAARDLWGHDADAAQTLTADLYESYLEPA
ncbi:MAG: hypothetical protein NVSMB30_11740 [Hymenobacter sp.]